METFEIKSDQRQLLDPDEDGRQQRSYFGLFIAINIIISLGFGLLTLLIDEDLYEISLEAFVLVDVFSLLDLGILILSFLLLFILKLLFKVCRYSRYSFKIIGFLPVTYKTMVNISYLTLFPLTILLFIQQYNQLPDFSIAFLIYQMIVGVFLIMVEIYDLLKWQTRSGYLMEIRTENDIYELDELEISHWKQEFRDARKSFKGFQEY